MRADLGRRGRIAGALEEGGFLKPGLPFGETVRVALRPGLELPAAKAEIRKTMNLSSSFDHRVVDGWDAASFIQEVKRLLERPLMLLSRN